MVPVVSIPNAERASLSSPVSSLPRHLSALTTPASAPVQAHSPSREHQMPSAFDPQPVAVRSRIPLAPNTHDVRVGPSAPSPYVVASSAIGSSPIRYSDTKAAEENDWENINYVGQQSGAKPKEIQAFVGGQRYMSF